MHSVAVTIDVCLQCNGFSTPIIDSKLKQFVMASELEKYLRDLFAQDERIKVYLQIGNFGGKTIAFWEFSRDKRTREANICRIAKLRGLAEGAG